MPFLAKEPSNFLDSLVDFQNLSNFQQMKVHFIFNSFHIKLNESHIFLISTNDKITFLFANYNHISNRFKKIKD